MTMKLTITNDDFVRTAILQKSDTKELVEIKPLEKVDVYLHKGCSINVWEQEF
jgi:hypothetical protein